MENRIAFNARATFLWKSDRLYRIYPVGNELFFIRIGGQGGISEGAHGGLHANPLGLLLLPIVFLYDKLVNEKKQTKIKSYDERGPHLLIRMHKHNFRVGGGDFVEARIDPPSLFAAHGFHVGRWQIALNNKKTMDLQFETLQDMTCALEVLPGILKQLLKINVRWDSHKNRFIRLAESKR